MSDMCTFCGGPLQAEHLWCPGGHSVEDREPMSEEHDEPTNELATGGVIEPNGYISLGDGSPEFLLNNVRINYENNWPANNPTTLNPGSMPYAWNNNAAASTWINPSYSQPVTYNIVPAKQLTEDRIREIVAEAIKRELYPEQDGIVSAHTHRRIKLHEEDGSTWRGLLRRVEKESEM